MRKDLHLPVKLGTLFAVFGLSACPGWHGWLPHKGGEHGPVAGSSPDAGTPDAGAADGGSAVTCGSRGLPECPAGQFCNFPEAASCGEADAPGECEAQPTNCTRDYMPVCGCNGRTYDNACVAASEGVSVKTLGECESEICGTFAGLSCPAEKYCNFAEGQGCDVADGSGVCRAIPEMCTADYTPVCGCDGVTYGNACAAARAGASVEREGECAS